MVILVLELPCENLLDGFGYVVNSSLQNNLDVTIHTQVVFTDELPTLTSYVTVHVYLTRELYYAMSTCCNFKIRIEELKKLKRKVGNLFQT